MRQHGAFEAEGPAASTATPSHTPTPTDVPVGSPTNTHTPTATHTTTSTPTDTPVPPTSTPPDTDGDGVPDEIDNCADVANSSQLNTEAANTSVNRPGADGFGDACDDDIDGDGYTNAQEAARGKDPLAYCDIMRADIDGDGAGTILDMTVLAGRFLDQIPPAPERYNQDADNAITILDLTMMANLFLENAAACP